MNTLKKYLGIILLAVAVLGTAGWVSRPQNTQETRSRAWAASTLSFDPSNASVGVGQLVSLDVKITPATNIVSATELYFRYDPARVELLSIVPSSAFSAILSAASINNATGQASITVGTPPLSPVKDPTSVATISFRTKTAGSPTTVTFTSATKVAALNEKGNVVSSLTPATIAILLPTPTPTPIPTVTPTPTPRPTVTPTPTPTATPTPTPTPLPGDLDRDGDVDIYDYNILVTNFGRTGTNVADIDGNGKVDIFDYNIIVTNFGK